MTFSKSPAAAAENKPLPAHHVTLAGKSSHAALTSCIVAAASDEPDATQTTIQYRLAAPTEVPQVEGDGFEILPTNNGHGATVTARTRFGLLQAARRMTEHLVRGEDQACIPLVASNPAVALRSGGFGGGDFEVDFPHGTDAQWDTALEGLAASGMNVMADLGMWSNWKMPVSYRAAAR